jgi:hypothetical protein
MTATGNRFSAPARAEQRAPRSAEEYLDGGASVAAKWPKVGFEVDGDVIGWSPTAIQMTDMKTGEPLYWENKVKTKESELRFPETSKENPCLQITIDLQCEPTGVTWESNRYIRKVIEDDDGVRTMYVNGQLAAAIRKARQTAAQKYKLGVRSAPLEAGAHCRVVRGEDKKFANEYYGFTFEAEWTPAAHNPAYQNSLMDSTEGPDGAGDDPWETGSQAESEEPPF